MSKILCCALGGVQEDGNNLYIVEVDDNIFILDAGSKVPSLDLHGVDIVVPDIAYLVENRDRVRGLFLTHAHDHHIGSAYQIIEEVKCKVYGTLFTLAVLKDKLIKENIKYDESSFVEVKSRTSITFKNIKVRFFELAHNIPDNVGISILTEDGNIVYTGNYNFDQNNKIDYSQMFRNLGAFSKEGVLALLTESLGADNMQNRGTLLEFKTRMNSILCENHNRILFTLYSDDLVRTQQIIDLATQNNKKIAILGIKTQRLINKAMELGYLKVNKENYMSLKFIDEENDNNFEDLVILVTGERHEPFFMLQRMSKRIDRLIHLNKKDTVVILTNPLVGTEKISARTLDMIYKVTSKVYTFKKDLLPSPNASREEIKQMINVLSPKYVLPVIGEFRHQYACSVVADCIGYKSKDIIILDKGFFAEFTDGKFNGFTKKVDASEILLDGRAFGNIGDVVMKDRALLANDGVLIICANVNPKSKRIVCGPEIITKGFLYESNHEDISAKIKEMFLTVSERFLSQRFINWSDYKGAIKSDISTLIYKTIKRNPIIIPVLISTDVDSISQKLSNVVEESI